MPGKLCDGGTGTPELAECVLGKEGKCTDAI